MKLYHATSEFAWERIQESGFIGVTEEILLSYIQEIFEELKVERKREIYYKRVSIDLEEYAPNGMVSFFPDYSDNLAYGRILGHNLGEAFGNNLKDAVKYASRITKTSYRDNLTKFSFLTQKQVPIILTVDVPTRMIANPKVIGSNLEHYTNGVVPVKYVLKLNYI